MPSGRLRRLCDISSRGDLTPGAESGVAGGTVFNGGEAMAAELARRRAGWQAPPPGSTLDPLSRDAHFPVGLDKTDMDLMTVDVPGATKLTVGIMAVVAQQGLLAASVRETTVTPE